jgi:hypothetical protein
MSIPKSPGGGIGRRARLRGVWPNGRAGSIPVQGTETLVSYWLARVFLFITIVIVNNIKTHPAPNPAC